MAVISETADKQVPWESSSLTGDFYFVPEKGAVVVTPTPAKEEDEDRLAEERARLEAERRRLAEDKRRWKEERKQAAERERLAQEKAKLEAERRRIAEEKRKLEEAKKRQVASLPRRPSVVKPSVPESVGHGYGVTYQSMKFFEGPYNPPELSKRQYTTRFPKSSTRYVFYELLFKNELWNKRDNPVKIVARYYKPDGSLMGQPVLDYVIPADWKNAYLWKGWGWAQAGRWTPGNYRVKIFIGNDVITQSYFTVY